MTNRTQSIGDQLSREYHNSEMPLETLAAKIDAALEKARTEAFDQGVAYEQHEAWDKKRSKSK